MRQVGAKWAWNTHHLAGPGGIPMMRPQSSGGGPCGSIAYHERRKKKGRNHREDDKVEVKREMPVEGRGKGGGKQAKTVEEEGRGQQPKERRKEEEEKEKGRRALVLLWGIVCMQFRLVTATKYICAMGLLTHRASASNSVVVVSVGLLIHLAAVVAGLAVWKYLFQGQLGHRDKQSWRNWMRKHVRRWRRRTIRVKKRASTKCRGGRMAAIGAGGRWVNATL